ncbi:hypothetical protein [Lichenicoccus roseus]|uniref:Uncharacterized protein n=1 Tax=Lichenicoccus roseus TaxID=2683649 RepID=A0A5R9J880_9PROT|nr:hypothetical protein [Lichenicoccus roseus]TLU73824.1 hypothetical protein FE263_00880 [Lichenicoccus roseus]
MSDAPANPITIPIMSDTIREVQGIMPDEGMLQNATQALLSAGFDRHDLSLPAARPPLQEATPDQGAENPVDEHDARQARTLANSTIGVAGAMIGGLVASVATGGAAIPAAAAAVAAGLGAGGLSQASFQGAANVREQRHDAQGARGELVLAALARDAEREALATKVLTEAGATRVETVEKTGNLTRIA